MKKETINSLQILIRAYYDYQNERIAMDGRLGIKKDGHLKKKTPERDDALLLYLYQRREEVFHFEKELEKDIMKNVSEHPLWVNFLSNVRGCGPIIAAVIITEFDIHKAPMVSNLISFAGLAPGKDRKEKGKKCPYNQFLKSKLCGVFGKGLIMAKSIPYSGYYYDYKLRLQNSERQIETGERLRKEDKKKKEYKGQTTRDIKWKDAYLGHIDQAAIRYMVKMFLKDLYVAWRELEGLEIRRPYEEEYLGRVHHAVAM